MDRKLTVNLLLALTLVSVCPADAQKQTDVFSQPISSDEPVPGSDFPPIPQSPDVSGGSRQSKPVGGAVGRNREIQARKAEMVRQKKEEQERRRQMKEARLSGGSESGYNDGGRYANQQREQIVNEQENDSPQPQSFLDVPQTRKSDFVGTSGGGRNQSKIESGEVEETPPVISQPGFTQPGASRERGQELTTPDEARLRSLKYGPKNRNQFEKAADRLGNRAVNRALSPLRRAIARPIRF